MDALPEFTPPYAEFTPPYVEVQTEALGLSAEEVEQLVTVPNGGRPQIVDMNHGGEWVGFRIE